MDTLNKIYRECSLKYSFIYPRYVSKCHPRDTTPDDENFTGKYKFPEDFVFENRTDELWYQRSKLQNGIIVPDNIEYDKKPNEYFFIKEISAEVFKNPVLNETEFYLNNLLDDQACLVKRSCGSWYGNTNTNERIKTMASVEIDGVKYTVSIKRIWGFEPDNVTSPDDLSSGVINGFSKRTYTLFVKHDDETDKDYYYPTVNNKILTNNQIKTIIRK